MTVFIEKLDLPGDDAAALEELFFDLGAVSVSIWEKGQEGAAEKPLFFNPLEPEKEKFWVPMLFLISKK